ncbi:hypothetical protein AA103581_2210 [Gluconobacter wancherniae NBRC 103581]|nr:hypothetical protein AA103581_2210 [Gluconobacter wancherniae NBRC 103581]
MLAIPEATILGESLNFKSKISESRSKALAGIDHAQFPHTRRVNEQTARWKADEFSVRCSVTPLPAMS